MKKEIIILASLIALDSINLKNNRNINLEDESFIVGADLKEIPEELNKEKKNKIDFSLSKIKGEDVIDFVKKLDYKLDEIKINMTQFNDIFKLNRITDLKGKIERLNITKDNTFFYSKSTSKTDDGKTSKKGSLSISTIYFFTYLGKLKRENSLPNVEIITFIDKKN